MVNETGESLREKDAADVDSREATVVFITGTGTGTGTETGTETETGIGIGIRS